jgi:hypothetical protein
MVMQLSATDVSKRFTVRAQRKQLRRLRNDLVHEVGSPRASRYSVQSRKSQRGGSKTHSPVAEEYLMLPVIYSMSVSLDGFIAGPDGDISWSAPDAEQFRP